MTSCWMGGMGGMTNGCVTGERGQNRVELSEVLYRDEVVD